MIVERVKVECRLVKVVPIEIQCAFYGAPHYSGKVITNYFFFVLVFESSSLTLFQPLDMVLSSTVVDPTVEEF